MSKYGHRNGNWFEAIVNKLGGEDAADRFLRGELAVSKPDRAWREQDGVIYLTVTSDGTTGVQWIERLEKRGDRVSDYAKSVLRSKDFKPTSGVMTEIAVLKGMLFEDDDRITKKICAEADKRNLTKPNAEVACLFREKFSDQEIEAMGLWWIIAMHEPIQYAVGHPFLLVACRGGNGRWLGADCDEPGGRWYRARGFAFVVAQVALSAE